jgi:PAS domain-containing protein/uncharacterized coiled-coil DUF342 family protein
MVSALLAVRPLRSAAARLPATGADFFSVDVSGTTRAADVLAVSDGVPAAVAALDGAGSLKRATRAFLDRFDDLCDGSSGPCPAEVDEIAGGKADSLTAVLDGVEADLVAAVDAAGRRMVVLTVPAATDTAEGDRLSPALEESLDESPAIIWLKDLDGRYLRVNRRYVDELGTDPERVCGRTDPELTAAWSIEGMRLEEEDSVAGRELLELEYRIGAFEERPAFTVLRFALRNGEGQPTATCSVAAPVTEEAVARSECERLMRIDRSRQLDAFAIRDELLAEWGLTLTDGTPDPPGDPDESIRTLLLERDQALAEAARLKELAEEPEHQGSCNDDAERRADELEGVIATEQARAVALEDSLAAAQARLSELDTELTTARAQLEDQAHVGELETAIAEQHTRAEELQDAVSAEQARSSELEESLAAAKARLSELETELTSAQAQLEDHQHTDDLETAAAEQQTRAEELQGAVSAEQARSGELEKSLATAKARVSELEASVAADRARADELETAAAEQQANAEELQGAVSAEQARSGELEESLGVAKARVSELETELTTIQAQLEDHQHTDELETAVDAEQARAGELEESLAAAKTRVSELEASAAADRTHADELQTAVAEQQTRAEELQDAVSAEQARSGELEESLAAAKTRVSDLETELTTAREQLEDQAHADELKSTVAAEQARSGELEESLAAAQARLSELETELTTAQAELEDHQHTDELETAVGAEQARAGALEESLAAAKARLSELETELTTARAQLEDQAHVGELETAIAEHHTRAEELRGAVSAEQARSGELEQSLAAAQARVSELETELTTIQAQLEEPHAPGAEAPDAHASASETGSGVRWNAGSQRTLSAALVGVTDWRSVLGHAVGTLGAEGGWDAAIAWYLERPRAPMTCAAIWTSEGADLASLESRTWKYRVDASTAEFGRARNRMAPTCLLELQSAEDPLLRVAAAEGMGSALLVPIGDGSGASAMIVLFSRTAAAPSAELMVALDAIGLQLGVLAQICEPRYSPRWETARV